MDGFTRRDFFKVTGATLLAASLPKLKSARANIAAPAPMIWRGSRSHRYVALTYDDCYLLHRMHDMESLLAEFPEFKITLFPVGVAILNLHRQDAGIWNRFYEQGHEIGYHSWDHENFGVLSNRVALEDFARWREALNTAMGFLPKIRFARPTYGNFTPSFDALCRTEGLVNTMWSTGWGGELEDGLRAAQNSRNGDIVLMHIRTEDYNTSVLAYPWLRANGWGAVTLSQLYDDVLLEQINPEGCELEAGSSLNRTCIE